MELNMILIDGYLQLLDNLSIEVKRALIERLSQRIDKRLGEKDGSFYKSFGAWHSVMSADAMIDDLRESRRFARNIEQL